MKKTKELKKYPEAVADLDDAKTILAGQLGIGVDQLTDAEISMLEAAQRAGLNTIAITDHNTAKVYEALEKTGNSRKKNIEAMSELGEKLSRLDDGFIVYSSDKNYTLNNKFGGFHAGKLGARPMDFLNNIYKNSRHFLTLLGTI